MAKKPTVLLVGAGAMGGALLRGWLAARAIDCAGSAVLDPGAGDALKTLCAENGVALNASPTKPFDIAVLAIKPQAADTILPELRGSLGAAAVLSVMAGKSCASIAALLGDHKKIGRAMPNLPAAIGRGVSGLFAPASFSEKDRATADTLMSAAGDTVWVESEQDIDLVTAVSGSGPAYFFLLTEALADAGVAAGLTPDVAGRLARATCIGAGAILDTDDRAPDLLRQAVTSPGGTTAAALGVLDGDDSAARKLLVRAVAAAAKRAGDLTD